MRPRTLLHAALLSCLAATAGAADLSGYTAEPQTPSGKFTTAAEVKPIMQATKASWVAVREFNGQDLLYVTQILSWRCGLVGLHVGVNGAPLSAWPMPPCHDDTAQPNAITTDDGGVYTAFPLGSVQSVQVELVYDDLTTETASFDRQSVLMP
ncbi:MAG: hypothetical protein ACU0DK_02065 [Pseudooceanicola sp.]